MWIPVSYESDNDAAKASSDTGKLTKILHLLMCHHIGAVIVSVLTPSVVERGFEQWSGQTKDYKIGICCFSTKHAALRRKIKDWLAQNQNSVSKQSDMSISGLLFQ